MEHDIKKLKGNKIYFPRGTSEWVGHSTEKILRITITSGGGMGGSKWYRYIEPTQLQDMGLNVVKDINSKKEILVNSNNIVEAEAFDLITAKYTCTNPNFNLNNDLCTLKVLADDAEDIIFMHSYKSMEEWTYG